MASRRILAFFEAFIATMVWFVLFFNWFVHGSKEGFGLILLIMWAVSWGMMSAIYYWSLSALQTDNFGRYIMKAIAFMGFAIIIGLFISWLGLTTGYARIVSGIIMIVVAVLTDRKVSRIISKHKGVILTPVFPALGVIIIGILDIFGY